MSSPYLQKAEARLAVLERIIPRTEGEAREKLEREYRGLYRIVNNIPLILRM